MAERGCLPVRFSRISTSMSRPCTTMLRRLVYFAVQYGVCGIPTAAPMYQLLYCGTVKGKVTSVLSVSPGDNDGPAMPPGACVRAFLRIVIKSQSVPPPPFHPPWVALYCLGVLYRILFTACVRAPFMSASLLTSTTPCFVPQSVGWTMGE
jgi:hypothetical protein